MKTKFLVFFIGLFLLVSFNFVQAQVTAMTPDLEALAQTLHQQIEDLKERILQLQEELKQITTELKEVEKAFKFTQNLRKGLRNKEVEYLQEFLSKYPEIYPEGLVTGYFGPLTEKAVKKFQEKHSEDILKPYGLNKGTGFVGEKTIAKINEILAEGAGASGQVPPGLTTAPGIQKKVATTTASVRKITICHYPPDNPDARHTIVVDRSALKAHLAHGDTIGACSEEPEPEPEDVCPNIEGVQETIPEGMFQNNEGNCVEPEPGAVLGCTDETATNYNSEATQDDGTCVYPDTTPPVISNFQPSGTITNLTPTLSLNTDENATCRYAMLYPILCTTEYPALCAIDQSFDTMLSTFSGAGTTYHYATLGTMATGTHTYYARCKDTAGNKNTDSASIIFTITSEPTPEPAPVISNYVRTPSGSEIPSSGEEYTHARIRYDVSDTVIACVESYNIGSLACYEKNGCDADHGYFVAPLIIGENTILIDCWDTQGRHATHTDVVSVVEEPSLLCTDSDGGANYYVKGTIIGAHIIGGHVYTSIDYCINDLWLQEYYCGADNLVTTDSYICPNGCQDGVCQPDSLTCAGQGGKFCSSKTPTEMCSGIWFDINGCCIGDCYIPEDNNCYDSDGGANYYVKGYVETQATKFVKLDNNLGRLYDACYGDMLREYTCEESYLPYAHITEIDGKIVDVDTTYTCPNGCQDGACLSADTTPPGEVINFTATAEDGQVNLSWTNPTDSDFAGTKILRKTGSYPTNITDGTQVYDGTGASHTDTGLANGTAYYYKAFAYDEVPNYSSGVGATATPTAPSSLTIRGRIVDALTNQPVTNSNLYIWNWKGGERRDFYINSDGTFSIDLTEDDIANAYVMYVNSVYISGSACYDQSNFTISKNSDGSVDYIRVNGPGAYSGITYRTVQPVGSEIDLGDYLVWPVTGFKLTSDIPVKFRAEFENGSGGAGNSNYQTVHGMSTLCPIDVNTRIILTDQFGNEYVSPYVKYPLSQHCSQVTLDYADGQFLWSSAGVISAPAGQSQFFLKWGSQGSGDGQRLAFIDRLLKDIQSQVAAVSAAILELLK